MAEHGHALRGFAAKLTRNPDEAADLYQDACIRIFRNIHRLDRRLASRAWGMRVMQNINLDRLRAERRRPATTGMELARDGDLEYDPPCPDPTPEDVAVGSCRLGEVIEAMYAMPPRQARALWLRTGEGMKFSEVARAMRCSEGSAKAMVHRAQKALRETANCG